MNFDVAMPFTLFLITMVSVFLERRIEGKMKTVFEGKEMGVRDAVMLVAAISVTVSIAIFVPQRAIMIVFLFAYSMLLFTFTYVFSDFQKAKARLFSLASLVVIFAAATISLFNIGVDSMVSYGALALYCLFGFTFVAFLHEEDRASTKERWYLAVVPPASFILLYVFFNRTPIWFPYLLDLYGIVFAVLIILYLGSLFTWRTTLIFAGLLTAMDIILVLVTGTMVSAASHFTGLGLPVLVSLPTLPAIVSERGVLYMSLGLGDFFFAGLLAMQTLKKYGKKMAVLSAITMSASFLVFEAFLLTYALRAFPGTLMIICGWLPIALWKTLKRQK